MKPKRQISRGERNLYLLCGCIALCFGGYATWLCNNALPNIEIPTPRMPDPNAYDYYVQAGKSLVLTNKPVDAVLDWKVLPTDARELARRYPLSGKEAWLKQNSQAFILMRQGFNYQYINPPERSLSSGHIPFASFRQLARSLCVESNVYQEKGQWDKAADSALDVIKLGTDVPHGGNLIAALVGHAVQSTGRNVLRKIIANLNAAQARRVAHRLESIMTQQVTAADTLEEEKWGQLSRLQEAFKGPRWWDKFASPVDDPRMALRLRLVSKRKVFQNRIIRCDALIANARLPYSSSQPPLPVVTDPLSEIIDPVFTNIRWSYARNDAGNALLLLTLALHAYQLERGRYPTHLSDLAPTYIKQVPADPFGGGESLRYKLDGNSYILWSIGPDKKDDGGRAIVSKSGDILAESQGDMVAGINR